jgi:hypothetical protein
MTQKNNEAHPELQGILEEAEATIITDVVESVARDFEEIESYMWKNLGDPQGHSQAWGVSIEATSMADAMDRIREMEESEVMTINKPDDLDSDEAGLLGIELLADGDDMYSMLFSRDLLMALAKKDPVGLIVRVGAHASEKATGEDVRPSQASDAQDIVLTCLCTNAAVYTIIRSVESGELIASHSAPCNEVEIGESKLIDAMLAAFMAPAILRDVVEANKDDQDQ